MIRPTTTLLAPAAAALALGALLAAGPANDGTALRFAPKAGTESVRSIKMERTIQGGDLSVVMDGNEVPAQFLPDLSFGFTSTSAVEVTDEFLAPEEDIDGAWRRRSLAEVSEAFSMEMDMSGETSEYDADATSELENEPFLIGRDVDGDVVARWADPDCSLDAELLDGMLPELDLEGLLPGEPVQENAAWEADAAALADVLRFPTDLPWTWSESAADYVPDPGENEYSGDLELRVTDIRTEDQTVLVTVGFSGELIEVNTKAGDLSQVPVADGTATDTTTTTFTVEGEYVWNASAHHLLSLTLEGEGEGEQLMVKDAGQPGPEYQSTTQHTAKLTVTLK